jgi:hypothetical protein
MSEIEDGTGSGRSARVGDQNRVHTHALAATVCNVAAQAGEAFNIGTDIITLTSDNESALLYFKNDESKDISILNEFINAGSSTGGTGSGVIRFYITPTSGTIIDDATPANVINRRANDAISIASLSYQGLEGKTIVGTSKIEIPASGGGVFTSEFILPKGASFTLTYEPPTGNTSIDVTAGLLVIKDYPAYTIE